MRHKDRVTIIESGERGYKIGPLLADVLRVPYFDGDERGDGKVPDRCVISRLPSYTLNQKYDGLTVDLRTIASQEKMECLKQVLQQLVSLRRSLK